jgi:hypothetical protein
MYQAGMQHAQCLDMQSDFTAVPQGPSEKKSGGGIQVTVECHSYTDFRQHQRVLMCCDCHGS